MEYTVEEFVWIVAPVAAVVAVVVAVLAYLVARRPDTAAQKHLSDQIRLLEADHRADMAQIAGLREELFYLGRLVQMLADLVEESGLILPDGVRDYLIKRRGYGPIVADSETVVLVQHALNQFFDLGELRQLAFEVGVEFDNLQGNRKEDKARELVLFVDRRGQLEMLVQQIGLMRPNVPLPWLGGRGPP